MVIGNEKLMHTLDTHGENKNEIRQINKRRQKEGPEYGIKKSGHEKSKVPTAYNYLTEIQKYT